MPIHDLVVAVQSRLVDMHIHPEPSRSSLQVTPGTEVQLKQTCVENHVAWFDTIAIYFWSYWFERRLRSFNLLSFDFHRKCQRHSGS